MLPRCMRLLYTLTLATMATATPKLFTSGPAMPAEQRETYQSMWPDKTVEHDVIPLEPTILALSWNVADGILLPNAPSNRHDVNTKKDLLKIVWQGMKQFRASTDTDRLPDLVALSFQESRPGKGVELGNEFCKLITQELEESYVVLGSLKTQWGGMVLDVVKSKCHWTSGLLVLSRESFKTKSIIRVTSKQHQCDVMKNPEKSLYSVGIKFVDESSLVLMGGHLPASAPAHRLSCLRDSMAEYNPSNQHRNGDIIGAQGMIIFGDLNFRTSPRDVSLFAENIENWQEFAAADEFSILVKRINSGEVTGFNLLKDYEGTAGRHLPSFKLHRNIVAKPASKKCKPFSCISSHALGKHLQLRNQPEEDVQLCYLSDRPVSWADQFLFHPFQATLLAVSSVVGLASSDHLPVVASFILTDWHRQLAPKETRSRGMF